jgi:hypothetical protein
MSSGLIARHVASKSKSSGGCNASKSASVIVHRRRVEQVELRAAAEHQADRVAGTDTERVQAGRDAAHALGVLGPRQLVVGAERAERRSPGVRRRRDLERRAQRRLLERLGDRLGRVCSVVRRRRYISH